MAGLLALMDRRRLPCMLFLCLSLCQATAQERSSTQPASEPSKATDPLNRSSPQSSVAGFLQACRNHDYARACSYLDLRGLPQTARLKDGSGLAQQMEKILDRDTHFDVAALSNDPNGSNASGLPANRERVDSFNEGGKTEDIELERIRLRSGVWVWVFSSDTIRRIPELVRVTSESPVEKHLPAPMVTWSLAGTSLWQWIALLVLVFSTWVLGRLLFPLALRLARPVLKRLLSRYDESSLTAFAGPVRLLVELGLFRFGLEWIQPSAQVQLYLGRLLALLFFLALFWLFLGLVDLGTLYIRANLRSRNRTLSYSALPLAARVLKILILTLIVAALLSEWGYNTTTIVASLGVGGIAIALAAQKTIENFFGGVSVVADRPVAVGDFCKFGDRMGTVEDIGLRSTRIRTPDRTLVSVPNGQFSTMTIENFSKRDKMLFHFMLNLRRDTKSDQVRDLLHSIADILSSHRRVDAGGTPVHFVGVGTYSLDLEISAYILTSDDGEFAQVRQDLLLSILDAVEAAGTALALPTQMSLEYYRAEQSPQPSAVSPKEPAEAAMPQVS